MNVNAKRCGDYLVCVPNRTNRNINTIRLYSHFVFYIPIYLRLSLRLLIMT